MADPDDHLDIIRAYLQEHGTGRRQDFIRLLGLEPEQGTLLLRRLTDPGRAGPLRAALHPAGTGEMTSALP